MADSTATVTAHPAKVSVADKMQKGLGIAIMLIGTLITVSGPLSGILIPGPRLTSVTLAFVVIGTLVIVIGGVITSMGESADYVPNESMIRMSANNPCPVCTGKDFTWGTVASPQTARFKTKQIGRGKPVLARTCDKCGNTLLFIKQKP